MRGNRNPLHPYPEVRKNNIDKIKISKFIKLWKQFRILKRELSCESSRDPSTRYARSGWQSGVNTLRTKKTYKTQL